MPLLARPKPPGRASLGNHRVMDDRAWGRLQESHRPRVFGLCRRILGGIEDAEDACGETFVRAERFRKRYDPSRPFAQWILSIASRISIDRLRRRGLERRIFDAAEDKPAGWEPAEAAPNPLEAALAGERRAALENALAGLEHRDRAALTMKYYAELSYEQIGEVLGLSRAHVGSLIYRAKRRLRQSLVETDTDPTRGTVS